MGVLEELDPNPYRFCERLPEVIRSRLTCYFIKKTIAHMEMYSKSKVMKVPNRDLEEYSIKYIGLLSLFGDYEPSIRQKVNEFYFGYVVSKEKGRGTDRNFTIMKKIVAEEYRYRDTVSSTFTASLEPKIHVSNHHVIKTFCKMFKDILRRYLGKDFEKVIKQEVIKAFARSNFNELATLKVSSRSYESTIVVPEVKPNQTTRQIREQYERSNPSERTKRPRVMESLKALIEEYQDKKGREPKHPIELLPFCLDDINLRGYWDSDIFPKSQHGGDREIHVLEIKMRVVQFYTELISRTLCRLIPSDTLTHPKEKENFVSRHYRDAQENLGEQIFTLGKSADATKWCQRNDSSKFAAVVAPFLPPVLRSFFVHVMYLWKKKRISFPIQFAANFQHNINTKSNIVYERMRDEFKQGKGIFTQAQSNKISVKSGMMQGILHYTSSFTHALIQEVMKKMQIDYLKRKKLDAHISVVQGSDDSAEMISMKGPASLTKIRLATTMLHWKEEVAKHFSIYTSRAKSSIGSLDLVEYNSEWMVRTNVIKPTFRWVSACMETTVTERFIDRIRINYNISSQVLEGGGKILEVAMVQLCQAWMHYMLIGLHVSKMSSEVALRLKKLKDPALGFYPLDSDFSAGITGVDFQLHKLFKDTDFGRGLTFHNIHETDIRLEEEEPVDNSVSKSLRSVLLKFSDAKLWRDQLRRMEVPELETLIEEVEKNPYLIYTGHKNWKEAKYGIFLKMFQPGVKESISTHSAAARLMSASAYMISRPCITIFNKGEKEKVSLFRALCQAKVASELSSKLPIREVFQFSTEYMEVLEYIEELEKKSNLLRARFRTKTKQKICVFEKASDEIPVVDMCRKVWFGIGKLPLSSRQVKLFWGELKIKYKFLHDDRNKTKEQLGMNEVELKNFLESLNTKPRHIVLLDTSAKAGSVHNAMTRIFWNGVKVILPGSSDSEESSFSLRSKIFAILTSWLSKDKKEEEIYNLIKNSDILAQLRVPARLEKLKVLHKWFKTRNKVSVIRHLKEKNLGTLGFFTGRQRGWGHNREGFGEWRGKIGDVSVHIQMEGNECLTIIVNKLVDLRNLGKALIDLITGFSLTATNLDTKVDHWLTPTGRIIGGAGKSDCIPIIIDPTLTVDILDQVADYNWTWNVGDNRIRIIAEINYNLKITILSIPFTQKDWDPNFVIDTNETLKYWSSGTPLPLSMIEKEIFSVIERKNSSLLKAIKLRTALKTESSWVLGELMEAIKKMLTKRKSIMEIELDEDPKDLKIDEIPDADIEAMLFEMNTEVIGDFDPGFLEQFEDNDDFSPDLFDLEDITGEIDAQISLFQDAPIHDEESHSDQKYMPKTNLTLSSIDNLTRITLGIKSFEAAIEEFRVHQGHMATGLIGILLSFFTGRLCVTLSDDEGETNTIEERVSNISNIIAMGSNISSLDQNEIKEYIDYIDEEYDKMPYHIRNQMFNCRRQLETALRVLSTTYVKKEDLEEINSNKLLLDLKEDLINLNLVSREFSDLPSNAFISVIKTSMDFNVDKWLEQGEISAQNQSHLREAIRRPYVTSLFIDALSIKLKVNIDCLGYTTVFPFIETYTIYEVDGKFEIKPPKSAWDSLSSTDDESLSSP